MRNELMCHQVILTVCNTLREEFSIRRISKSIINFGDFLAAILIFFSIFKDESSTSAQISIWAMIIQREKTMSAKRKCFYENKNCFQSLLTFTNPL